MRTAIILVSGLALVASARASATQVCWVPAHYLAPQDYSGNQLTSGDLDGDGDIDISFITRHYWNVGTPETPSWALGSGVYDGVGYCLDRRSALGDLDADGDLDLVTTCRYDWDGKLHLYENESGSASPEWEEVMGVFEGIQSQLGPLEPSLADIDADADLDLLILTDFGVMILVENTGSASEPSWSETGHFSGLPIHGAADLGDIDDDGDLDLIVVGGGSPARCWENVGTPQASSFVENPSMLLGVESPDRGYGIELLDIDADEDLDLLISGDFGTGNFLYLNEQITPIQTASWTSIKALYR